MVLILSPEKPAEPVQTAQKRKHDDVDSEEELFMAFEKGKKKASLENSADAEVKADEKENQPAEPKSPVAKPLEKIKDESSTQHTPKPLNKTLTSSLNSPKPASPSSYASPSQKNGKSMIQSKIAFGKPASSPKPAPDEIKKKQQEVAAEIAKRPNGEWVIQDYIYNEQWKKLLKDEFEKPYFNEINQFLHTGYNKGIFRPPKELVFNAFNSTRLDDVSLKRSDKTYRA